MNKNKGFIGIGLILAIVLGIVVVGGGAYYLGKSGSKQEVKNPENILPNNENQNLPVVENKNLPVVNNNQPTKVTLGCMLPSITVLNPNEKETYTLGQTIDIKWTSNCIDANKKISIGVNKVVTNQDQAVEDMHSIKTTNSGSYKWLISKDMPIGQYEIYVSYTLENGYESVFGKSLNLITINSVTADANFIKQTGCGVSFSKTSEWSVISNTTNEIKLDIPGDTHTGFAGIDIKCVLGNSITDTDAKFGNITYFYDTSKKAWVETDNKEGEGITPHTTPVLAVPLFTTADGFPVFRGTGRWLTYIIPISPSSILYLNEGDTEGGYTQTLINLVKTIKKL